MIPPVVYELSNQQELAKQYARNLGTTATLDEQLIDKSHICL